MGKLSCRSDFRGRRPDTLYHTNVIGITNTDCEKRMNDYRQIYKDITITDTMFCAIGAYKTPKTDVERLENITFISGHGSGDSGGNSFKA